jgi:hypothetical protein
MVKKRDFVVKKEEKKGVLQRKEVSAEETANSSGPRLPLDIFSDGLDHLLDAPLDLLLLGRLLCELQHLKDGRDGCEVHES